ncbi:uncharacterized protein LOC129589445 [Paramacrobiotus metropolitanus]|uniref:uncharacterized protein LOC129589445 n=1 Tax=Paramacrobiotus metropolitanus TaxID=2943436 RepID=UPI0024460A77|nr:uncharacterized protein LOC129589445 [Paramacrobiotus metropolitanus]
MMNLGSDRYRYHIHQLIQNRFPFLTTKSIGSGDDRRLTVSFRESRHRTTSSQLTADIFPAVQMIEDNENACNNDQPKAEVPRKTIRPAMQTYVPPPQRSRRDSPKVDGTKLDHSRDSQLHASARLTNFSTGNHSSKTQARSASTTPADMATQYKKYPTAKEESHWREIEQYEPNYDGSGDYPRNFRNHAQKPYQHPGRGNDRRMQSSRGGSREFAKSQDSNGSNRTNAPAASRGNPADYFKVRRPKSAAGSVDSQSVAIEVRTSSGTLSVDISEAIPDSAVSPTFLDFGADEKSADSPSSRAAQDETLLKLEEAGDRAISSASSNGSKCTERRDAKQQLRFGPWSTAPVRESASPLNLDSLHVKTAEENDKAVMSESRCGSRSSEAKDMLTVAAEKIQQQNSRRRFGPQQVVQCDTHTAYPKREQHVDNSKMVSDEKRDGNTSRPRFGSDLKSPANSNNRPDFCEDERANSETARSDEKRRPNSSRPRFGSATASHCQVDRQSLFDSNEKAQITPGTSNSEEKRGSNSSRPRFGNQQQTPPVGQNARSAKDHQQQMNPEIPRCDEKHGLNSSRVRFGPSQQNSHVASQEDLNDSKISPHGKARGSVNSSRPRFGGSQSSLVDSYSRVSDERSAHSQVAHNGAKPESHLPGPVSKPVQSTSPGNALNTSSNSLPKNTKTETLHSEEKRGSGSSRPRFGPQPTSSDSSQDTRFADVQQNVTPEISRSDEKRVSGPSRPRFGSSQPPNSRDSQINSADELQNMTLETSRSADDKSGSSSSRPRFGQQQPTPSPSRPTTDSKCSAYYGDVNGQLDSSVVSSTGKSESGDSNLTNPGTFLLSDSVGDQEEYRGFPLYRIREEPPSPDWKRATRDLSQPYSESDFKQELREKRNLADLRERLEQNASMDHRDNGVKIMKRPQLSGSPNIRSAQYRPEPRDPLPQLADAVHKELLKAFGEVSVTQSKGNYQVFSPDSDVSGAEFSHVLEVSEIPTEFSTADLDKQMRLITAEYYDLKWVDDNHALAIFSSAASAANVLRMRNTGAKIVLKTLENAGDQTRRKARFYLKLDDGDAGRDRPDINVGTARRMLGGALGVTIPVSRNVRQQEVEQLKEARDRKQKSIQRREDIWEGNV